MLPALLLAAAAILWGRGSFRRFGCILMVMAVGFLLGFRAWHPALPEEGEYRVSGVIVQAVSLRDDGQVQTLLDHVTLNGQPQASRAYWTYYLAEGETLPEQLRPGAWIEMAARVYHPQGESNPGGFDFREYLLQRGVQFGIYGAESPAFPAGRFTLSGAAAALRVRLTQQLISVMGSEGGAYASAILLGERDFLPDGDVAAFRQLGITHILSVSGYHVGVLALLLDRLLTPLRLRRRVRTALIGMLLAFYCLLTGAEAPVIRAAMLYLLVEYGHLRNRQNLGLHLLCLCASLQLIVNPTLLFGASFQLTYGAMLGVLVVCPYLMRLFSFRSPVCARLYEALCAGFAAQLGVLPAQLYWFGELPLLSLAVNLPVIAFSGGLMALYWLTLALLPVPLLREAAGFAASAATSLLLHIIRLLGSLPGITLWVRQADALTLGGWVLLMTGLSVLIPRSRRLLRRGLILTGTLLMLCLLLPLPHDSAEYIQFSVGEADAALLHDEDMVVVIDAGEDQTLAAFLHQRRLGVDALFLTHLHSDHAGGLQALMDQGIPVERCCLPQGAEAMNADEGMLPLLDVLAATGTEIIHISRGDRIGLPGGSLLTLWPEPALLSSSTDANDGSLALHVTLHGTAMLLTGDLSGQHEAFAALPADLLKAAHHGSDESTLPEFLGAVSPGVILLSSGEESRLASLQQRTGDIPVYDTRSSGAVTVRFTEGAFDISTYLPSER